MYRVASMLATAALLLSADSSGVLRTTPASQLATFPATENPPALRGTSPDDNQGQPSKADSESNPGNKSSKGKPGTLQPESRLSLVRYIDGELVQVVRSIPSGKKGFHLKAGGPFNENALHMAVASAGASINPGDRAQISDLQFKEKQIIVDINGGGRGKTRLRDRIHLEVGGVGPTVATTGNTSATKTDPGATLYLDFDKPLPEMSADQLKEYLSSVIDFSKRHSAAVQWVESLPPEIQQAIQDKKPVVGMDHDMVLAALGRPDRKVREKGADGAEIEDWIYGTPPAKTIFVSFEGDKVKEVHQYPQ